ncbi:MAG: DUF192 domain-containing protein [Planctomycetota bacterium]
MVTGVAFAMIAFAGAAPAIFAWAQAQTRPAETQPDDPGAPDAPPTLELVLGEETFHLEIADTPAAIQQGLMHRTSIADDGGMLFVFPDVEHRAMWMKNCLVPIDVAFLNDNLVVTAVHEMEVERPGTPDRFLRRYASRQPAQYAIELRGGRAAELGLQAGQVLDGLPLPGLKGEGAPADPPS